MQLSAYHLMSLAEKQAYARLSIGLPPIDLVRCSCGIRLERRQLAAHKAAPWRCPIAALKRRR